MESLREAVVQSLEQVDDLVSACAGPVYNQESEQGNSGIGRHIRHILDHFGSVQQGWEKGLIDYNYRNRDSAVESDAGMAQQLIYHYIEWITQVDLSKAEEALQVESEISVQEEQNMCFSSNLKRELCFLITHTVHHIAYAKLLAQQSGILLDAHLGVAPSTMTYLRQQSQ